MYPGSANVSERRFEAPSLAISTVIFALRPNDSSAAEAVTSASASAESTAPGHSTAPPSVASTTEAHSAAESATRAHSPTAPAHPAVETPSTELPSVGSLWLPVVRRIREPYKGLQALPGGPIAWNESLGDAAGRNLRETTNLSPKYLEQLYAFGTVDRSPDRRVVSIVYWALVDPSEADQSVAAENVTWLPADRLPRLAFDHNTIVDYALWRLRNKVEYSQIAHHFLGETFTLAQLREVHEAVLGRSIDPGNFRRQILSSGTVTATGEKVGGTRHRPAHIYRFNDSIDKDSERLAP
ncbi:NUDIX domain-containing protein [Saxibacter everestensis]|uniref:NUDIX domain-containing protein n=1 Tax=Saxibacter everestensis TaxID=2909229 RepID=A0ABY8QPZ6_9MICO|nr:NUDIX domain-containing protein [Brevibacteriaceae bacterium ZFBP1038]